MSDDDVQRAGDPSETPFRLYTMSSSGGVSEVRCVTACDDLSVGDALIEAHKRGDVIRGIMYRPVVGEPGDWIVNPWQA